MFMEALTLKAITKGENWIGFGIAGNQAEHLNQAGEAEDFKEITAPENAPKGMFPWYLPGSTCFLGVNPLSSKQITLASNTKLQPEPEIALVVKFKFSHSPEKIIEDLSVIGFTVFNDCSRRITAPKISLKKNWGVASQGMAQHILLVDDFTSKGGKIDNFRLSCYIKRKGELIQYGKDTAVTDYCYFNQPLVDWIINQINTQQDHGPLEKISSMLLNSQAEYGVIGIGATCYSPFGNSDDRFLIVGDQVIIIAYDSTQHSANDIEKDLAEGENTQHPATVLVLRQTVQ